MPIIGSSTPCTVFMLGPTGSGKTCVLLGLYLAVREQGEEIEYSSELQSLLDASIYNQSFPRSNERDTYDISFTIREGGIVSKDIDFKTIDYAGEYFPRLVGKLEQISTPSSWIQNNHEPQDPVDELVGFLFQSDVILLLFDGPRLYENELSEKNTYFTLISELMNPNETYPSIIPVVTKFDELYDKINKDEIQYISKFASADVPEDFAMITDRTGQSVDYEPHKSILNALIQHNEPPVLSDLDYYPVALNPRYISADGTIESSHTGRTDRESIPDRVGRYTTPTGWGFYELWQMIYEKC